MSSLPAAPVLVAAGVLGLLIGSFLNVVIYRMPRKQSLSSPPSQCPSCGNRIRARHNVPVLGWLVLRGRCHDCKAPISPRYPLVEFGTGVAFVAVTAALLRVPGLIPAGLYLASVALVVVLIVRDRQRVPRRLVVPAPFVAAALAGAAYLVAALA